ncbi:hypothetical protein [Helicobacter cetorum]|nr:hypothetical protein [Helicobacter cetorum]
MKSQRIVFKSVKHTFNKQVARRKPLLTTPLRNKFFKKIEIKSKK